MRSSLAPAGCASGYSPRPPTPRSAARTLPELHEEFVAAGFHRILQPRRFGGYEFGLDTFYRVIIEISSADAGIGWNLCLGSAHALQVGAFFPEQAQAELFGPDGHFVGPSRAIPRGKATPAPGGYRVSGRWDYCSGATYSTHVIALALVAGSDERIMVAIPRSDYEILDDWGRRGNDRARRHSLQHDRRRGRVRARAPDRALRLEGLRDASGGHDRLPAARQPAVSGTGDDVLLRIAERHPDRQRPRRAPGLRGDDDDAPHELPAANPAARSRSTTSGGTGRRTASSTRRSSRSSARSRASPPSASASRSAASRSRPPTTARSAT